MLKPGGWPGLVWNVVAEPREPWELAIADDSDEYNRASKGTVDGLTNRLEYLPRAELEFRRVDWEWELTREHPAAFLATTSMAIATSPEERTRAFERSRAELRRVCDAQGRAAMPVRHVASCVRWTPGPG